MKKIFASLLAFAILLMLPACSKLPASQQPSATESSSTPPPKSEASSAPGRSQAESSSTPDAAAEELMQKISDLNADRINELAGEYFSSQQIPEEYYSLLKPMSERVSYKIGNYKVEGDKAMVDVSVTAVDAQSAINSVMAGAATHLIILQMTGKDVSNPEKIIAEYAAANIEWDSLPTIKTDATLYLITGADGEWKVDATNPDNIGFLNAISGGGVDVANNFQSFVDRVAK